jgi:hypothetical protein
MMTFSPFLGHPGLEFSRVEAHAGRGAATRLLEGMKKPP